MRLCHLVVGCGTCPSRPHNVHLRVREYTIRHQILACAAVTAVGTSSSVQPHDLSLDEGSQRIFVLAATEARQRSHDYIGTEHILLALMREADPVIMMVLRDANMSPEQVSARVEEMLRAQEAAA